MMTYNVISARPINSGIKVEPNRVDVSGTLYCNDALVSSSDRNIKNTISAPTEKFSILFDSLTPCKYNNGTSGRLHFGFIAQEVDDAMSTANIDRNDFAALCISNQGTDNEHWGLRYGEFVALNTWQIQKAKKRITELENKVAELEALIKE